MDIMVERLWRSVKYEEVYLKDYESVGELTAALKRYLAFYNEERPHQSHGGRTPAECITAGPAWRWQRDRDGCRK
jgi:putative transposase